MIARVSNRGARRPPVCISGRESCRAAHPPHAHSRPPPSRRAHAARIGGGGRRRLAQSRPQTPCHHKHKQPVKMIGRLRFKPFQQRIPGYDRKDKISDNKGRINMTDHADEELAYDEILDEDLFHSVIR